MLGIKVAMIQMHCPKGYIETNLASTAQYIREASDKQADVALFPEMSITGYIDPVKSPEAVLTLDNAAIRQFCDMTKGTSIMAIAGIVENNPQGKPFITQIIATDGKLQGYYRKINVAPDEVKWFAPASDTPIFEYRNIPFGVAICADVGHGDLFAAYVQKGAKIVFAAAAPGLYGSQESRNWQSGFEWWRGKCAEESEQVC